jgi:hypothetical protein
MSETVIIPLKQTFSSLNSSNHPAKSQVQIQFVIAPQITSFSLNSLSSRLMLLIGAGCLRGLYKKFQRESSEIYRGQMYKIIKNLHKKPNAKVFTLGRS